MQERIDRITKRLRKSEAFDDRPLVSVEAQIVRDTNFLLETIKDLQDQVSVAEGLRDNAEKNLSYAEWQLSRIQAALGTILIRNSEWKLLKEASQEVESWPNWMQKNADLLFEEEQEKQRKTKEKPAPPRREPDVSL